MIDLDIACKLERLRRPFAEDEIQYKPVYTGDYELDTNTGVSYIPESAYRYCEVCRKVHEQPAKHLKYVGHARVTKRLNEVDDCWSWEPFALDERGLPLVQNGMLWIRLKVLGVEKIGVGAADGKCGPDATKEMIGDAIRNAAMRFGCGLELWIDNAPYDGWHLREPDARMMAKHADKDHGEVQEGPFAIKRRPYSTKAQNALVDELERAVERGCDAKELTDWIAEEYGRPYYSLNKQEVDGAIEYIRDVCHADATSEEVFDDGDSDEEVIVV